MHEDVTDVLVYAADLDYLVAVSGVNYPGPFPSYNLTFTIKLAQ